MKNFTFAMKWHEILKSFPEDIRKEVYFAVIEYAATGQIIDLQPLARMAFDFIRYEIDEKARRREARLAKKQQNETRPEAKTDTAVDKIIDKFYSQGRAPKPVTVSNGGVHVTMSEERIRNFVAVCVQDMLAKGHKPEKDGSRFMSSLGSLVANRFEVLRQDILSRRPTAQFSEVLWEAMEKNAHEQFAA